jgi:TolB protein
MSFVLRCGSAVVAGGALIMLGGCTGPSGRPPSTTTASSSSATATPTASSLAGHISFGRFEGGGVSMFTANADGSGVTELLPGSDGEGPKWSPDGSQLAVTATNKGGMVGSVVNADGTHQRVFAHPAKAPNVPCNVWSPDAKRLACEGFDDADPERAGVYTVSVRDGQDLVRVTNHRESPCSYSPDGQRILFMRLSPDDEEHDQLMTVNVDGSDAKLVTQQRVGLSCDWSPDGKSILSEVDGSLVLFDLAGKATAIPVPGAAHRGAFSPDGTHIIFSMNLDGQEDIYLVRIDGSELTRITDTAADEEFGDWGP